MDWLNFAKSQEDMISEIAQLKSDQAEMTSEIAQLKTENMSLKEAVEKTPLKGNRHLRIPPCFAKNLLEGGIFLT